MSISDSPTVVKGWNKNPRAVSADKKLKPRDRSIFNIIAGYLGQKSRVRLLYSTIAEDERCSARTVIRAIANLKACGHLDAKRTGRSCIFTLSKAPRSDKTTNAEILRSDTVVTSDVTNLSLLHSKNNSNKKHIKEIYTESANNFAREETFEKEKTKESKTSKYSSPKAFEDNSPTSLIFTKFSSANKSTNVGGYGSAGSAEHDGVLNSDSPTVGRAVEVEYGQSQAYRDAILMHASRKSFEPTMEAIQRQVLWSLREDDKLALFVTLAADYGRVWTQAELKARIAIYAEDFKNNIGAWGEMRVQEFTRRCEEYALIHDAGLQHLTDPEESLF